MFAPKSKPPHACELWLQIHVLEIDQYRSLLVPLKDHKLKARIPRSFAYKNTGSSSNLCGNVFCNILEIAELFVRSRRTTRVLLTSFEIFDEQR